MKNFLLLVTSICAATIIFTSCQRQPEASFITDKSTYVAGETVTLTNTSLYGDHYVWTMPDGSTVNSTNATYTSSTCDADGSLNFRLEAYSRNDRKTSEAVSSANEQARTGNVTFWTDDPYQVTVTFGGVDADITQYYNQYSGPDYCDVYGCANYDGCYYCQSYDYYATDGTLNWSGTITINYDCYTYGLFTSKGKKLSNPIPGKNIPSSPVSEQKVSNIAQHTKVAIVKLGKR